MRTASIAILVIALVAPHAPALAKLPPCPGGRYLVSGPPLAGELDGPSMDVVEMAGKMVGVASGCAAVKSRVRATARGTKIRARFLSCSGFTGKAIMNATITEHCRTLAGTFVAKSAGIMQPFLASLSGCGDGIWDPDGGEACDAGLGPCGDLCTACACAGATTTTVTGTTSPTSTEPGATSTTTGTSPSSSTTTTPSSPTTSTTGGPGATTSSTATPTTTTHAPTTSTTSGGGGTTTSSSTMPALPTTTTTSTTLAGPDLIPFGWMSPGVVVGNANTAIQFTVKNNGTATATAPWYDYILLSTDTVVGNDTAIALPQRTVNLAAGAAYIVNVQPTMPKVASGNYYFFLHTDGAGLVTETNDNNNLGGFVAVTVTNPDLASTAFSGPASGTAGGGISVSYTVKNQGNAIAFATWTDRVLLSTDASFGGDTEIGAFVHGTNLGVNVSYSATQSATLPVVSAGTYYLFFETDSADGIYEGGSDANNVRGPVTITIS
jgi:hypothetical protein